MALTMWPALPGLQRSFRRIRHDLSRTFARPPGPWSLACDRACVTRACSCPCRA